MARGPGHVDEISVRASAAINDCSEHDEKRPADNSSSLESFAVKTRIRDAVNMHWLSHKWNCAALLHGRESHSG